LALALLVQWPYFDALFMEDDFDHASRAHRVWQGSDSWSEYLTTPHNEHWLPAWRLWLAVNLKLFGPMPQPWHLQIAVAQAWSAVCLYVLIRRYTGSIWSAVAAACLWSGAAIGGTESPLIWIAASHLTFGVAWLLTAMVCLSGINHSLSKLWAIGMGISVSLAILSMGTMWLFVPILGLQYWCAERPTNLSSREKAGWLACGLVPYLGLGIFQFAMVRSVVLIDNHDLPDNYLYAAGTHGTFALRDLLMSARLTANQFGIALAQLFNLPLADHATAVGIAASAVLVWLLAKSSSRLAVLGVALLAIGGYTWLVSFSRLGLSERDLLGQGRYIYLPTMFWTLGLGLLVGVALDAVSLTRWRWSGACLALGLLASMIFVQRNLAQSSSRDLTTIADRATGNPSRGAAIFSIDDALLVLNSWQRTSADGVPMRVVEIPIAPPGIVVLSDLLNFLGLNHDDGIEVVPGSLFTAADLQRVFLATEQSHARCASIWCENLQCSYDASQFLLALADQARQQGNPIRVPDLPIHFAPQNDALASRVLRYQFPEGLPGLEFVSRTVMPPQELIEFRSRLARIDNPVARAWLAALDLPSDLATAGKFP
jgi:hypothetical protein